MEKYHLVELISKEEIEKRITELANEIKQDYGDDEFVCVGLLKGTAVFMTDLIMKIKSEKLAIDFMTVSTYPDKVNGSEDLKVVKDVDRSLDGKNVLVLDDIIGTGTRLKQLKDMFTARHTKSLKICTFLDKESQRMKDIDIDYIGFKIEDCFVAGYGIDYKELHRNLPYVAKVIIDD